ncbi:YqaE/Pmp3 family membrane protein [Kingella oralis]|uniref:YqaE/Pmp3 family membrane protein n=1 Tax=Kingella oralis TaxID=505 RepID=UPI0028D8C95E|nr:YqaE/Pmp3 family membrane protein [uncultured Kingella sp.]
MSENSNQPAGNVPDQTVLLILSIIVPPLAVYMASNGNPKQMGRTIAALVGMCLFSIPGIVYALDVVLDKKWFYPKIDEMLK